MSKARSIEERIAKAKQKVLAAQAKYNHLIEIKENGSMGDRIKAIVKSKGLTYQEVADRMGVSRQRVDQILKSYYLSAKVVGRVARALEVTTDEIIFGGDSS